MGSIFPLISDCVLKAEDSDYYTECQVCDATGVPVYVAPGCAIGDDGKPDEDAQDLTMHHSTFSFRNVISLLEHYFLGTLLGCLGFFTVAILASLLGFWLLSLGWSEEHAMAVGIAIFVTGIIFIGSVDLLFWSLLVPDLYRKSFLTRTSLATVFGVGAAASQYLATAHGPVFQVVALILFVMAGAAGLSGLSILIKYGSAPPK